MRRMVRTLLFAGIFGIGVVGPFVVANSSAVADGCGEHCVSYGSSFECGGQGYENKRCESGGGVETYCSSDYYQVCEPETEWATCHESTGGCGPR
jgi:hypothetical protein